MIVTIVRFQVLAEYAEEWPELTRQFTEATRAEPGNRRFRWSRRLDDPAEYMAVEAHDDDAIKPHERGRWGLRWSLDLDQRAPFMEDPRSADRC